MATHRGLSQRASRISDPVHGYVSLSPIERLVLDQPVSQRLRWVAQNGLAQLVYPSSVTARFSHSLGTMHLASQFLAAARTNSTTEMDTMLIDGLIQYGRSAGVTARDIKMWSREIDSDALVAARVGSDSGREWWVFAEQALRLAAFFHDLGHLAFSHDFEFALRDYASSLRPRELAKSAIRTILEDLDEPPHEKIGHRLAPKVLAAVASTHTVKPAAAFKFLFAMAQSILEADYEAPTDRPGSSMRLLHLLIDGEIDADRCDYILRDARGFGFDFAGYDLARLLDNLVIVERLPGEVDRPPLDVAIRPQGLAAAESFFLARYRSYQYNTRHHKVAQVGAALRYCIRRILSKPPKSLRPEITRLLDYLGQIVRTSRTIASTREQLAAFALHDDMSWMALMRRAASLDPTDPWLSLVCWRQPTVSSLWKRRSEFPVEDLKAWNAKLPKKGDIEAGRAWQSAIEGLETRHVLVLRHEFKPFAVTTKSGQDKLRIADSGTLTGVSELSPLLRQLREAWMSDVQLHAAQPSTGRLTANEVIQALSLT